MNFLRQWRFILSAILITLLFYFSSNPITGPKYYSHVIYGGLKILVNRTSLVTLLSDKKTPNNLKKNLLEIKEMREFAISELGLPDTESFTTYVDTKRDYVTWVLTATPEFSVIPKKWCFPVAGCSPFLGFFNEKMAEKAKNKLVQEGYDVSLRGVSAYSTIGWFTDPVMNTHFNRSPEKLAGLVFHEKAHEKIFIKDDTAFNEAFATFIEQTGQSLWIIHYYGNNEAIEILVHEKHNEDFSELIRHTNYKLRVLYRSGFSHEKMRVLKKEIFREMQTQYSLLKKEWGGYNGYDDWFARDLNNADIGNEDSYKSLVPFFQKLFNLSGKNFDVFYKRVETLAKLPKEKRYSEIEKILSE